MRLEQTHSLITTGKMNIIEKYIDHLILQLSTKLELVTLDEKMQMYAELHGYTTDLPPYRVITSSIYGRYRLINDDKVIQGQLPEPSNTLHSREYSSFTTNYLYMGLFDLKQRISCLLELNLEQGEIEVLNKIFDRELIVIDAKSLIESNKFMLMLQNISIRFDI